MRKPTLNRLWTPQKFSTSLSFFCGFSVYKLIVAPRQQAVLPVAVVGFPGFLPTMKPQLSQLPLIVGYGRVMT
jgi:hypothetical protein